MVDALTFLGGMPKLIVCDNLRAGVTQACRYEPGINRTCQRTAGSTAVSSRVMSSIGHL
jgi:hypothetical protein